MRQPVTMPALSDTMNNGRLVKWLKQVGDPVKRGDVVAEIETDKAVMEVEAFHDGFLGGPLSPADAEYKVGTPIGYITDTRDEAGAAAPQAAPMPHPPAAPQPAATPAAPAAPAAPPPPAAPAAPPAHRASPYARRLAHELGVDLSKMGTGTSAVHAAEVVEASAHSFPELAAGPAYRIERTTSFRESVAQTMIASLAAPMFRVTAHFCVGPLLSTAKAEHLSVNLLFARAAAFAIREHPLFNAVYTPDGLAHRDRIDIGIAVDSPEGLITPVLRDVAGRSFAALTEEWRGLLDKAKARRLVPADYRGATFYISDLGVFSVVHSFDSLIPPGAAALLSIAAEVDDKAFCTLNCDHRVVFGGDAARFLTTLGTLLEDVQKLTS